VGKKDTFLGGKKDGLTLKTSHRSLQQQLWEPTNGTPLEIDRIFFKSTRIHDLPEN